MNDEIKEMLELHIKNDIDLLPKNQKTVLDYITNLQEENERLNQYLSYYQRYGADMLHKNNILEQRIEKAVEYINHLSKEPNVFGHYGIHNDCAKWLLNILNGRSDE